MTSGAACLNESISHYLEPVAEIAMWKSCLRSIVLLFAIVALPCSVGSADDAAFERTRDVIYGRKHGTALTMDVFTPQEKANGAAPRSY